MARFTLLPRAVTTSTLVAVATLPLAGAAASEAFRFRSEILPYDVRHYDQTLDHFDPSSLVRWPHRYLINDDYFGRPSPPFHRDEGVFGGESDYDNPLCPGPILVYTGNEGGITGFWNGTGFIHHLARKWGGLLLFPEERYYGESIPSSDMKYLSTEQVLSDYVELINHVKKDYGTYGDKDCPVVAFGGSYGGTLATFLRVAHPDVVIGALAASAPIGYYDKDGWKEHGVDEYSWADIAARSYKDAHPRCLDAIHAASDAIDAARPDEFADAFQLCKGWKVKPQQSSLFIYALEGLPQENYPYSVRNKPAWPVNAACSTLVSAVEASPSSSSSLLVAAANVTFMAMGYVPSSSLKCFRIPDEGPGNVPGDGPGTGSWGYQSCTETLHQFSSRGFASRGLRNYNFSMLEAVKVCEDTWGEGVVPNSTALTDKFGGYRLGDGLTNVSNIIWSVGLLDPWTGGCFRGQYWKASEEERKRKEVHFFEMAMGAHHLDLRGDHPEDPSAVQEVRRKEEEVIQGWIDKWVAEKKKIDVEQKGLFS